MMVLDPENEGLYRVLRAEFDAAYEGMKNSSREFSGILMMLPGVLCPEERKTRKDAAAQAYEDAHQHFLASVRDLNDFLLGHMISSGATPQAATQMAAAQH